MNEIQVFTHNAFGTIRTVLDKNNNPLFCAKDVAVALGYNNTNDAIKRHCKGVAFHYPLETAGGTQNVRFITEGDMYRLIASSKLESAVKFESWIFDEVLPSIRKTGGYMVARSDETPEETMARAVLLAQDTINRINARNKQLEAENDVKSKRITQMRPKEVFADAVTTSKTSILVGELAKLIRQNGYDIGQNRLFAWMRDNGYLIKGGSAYNMPTQRAADMGLFEVKETAITHSDGHTTVKKTTKVTGKGQVYFINKFCGDAQQVMQF